MPYTIVIVFALLSFSGLAMAQDFFVAATGNDQADGLSAEPVANGSSGPFQTLARAQQAIRDLKKDGAFKEPVTVHIQAGNYPLQKPLELDIRDTGFAGREIHWQAENGPAIISAGIFLSNCAQGDNKVWNCPTAGLGLDKIKYLQTNRKQGNIPGFELFINQQRLHLARWPNTEWAHIKLPLDEKTRFSVFETLPDLPSDLTHVQVHILAGNDWYDQYIGVSTIDQNQITLSSKTGYPLASGRRFYLQNIRSELDAAGEWFYDQPNDTLLFIPPDNIPPKDIVVSARQNLLVIKGTNYASFSNLTFQSSTDVAISIEKSNHLTFDGIDIHGIGGRAIEAKDSSDVTISNSHIHDTGAGGISISGGDRNSLQSSNNLIHNNHISDFGQVIMMNMPALEIIGVGARVTHNLVENNPGPGIFINGNEHLLEKNEIRHVCEQASDCGAIYSGRDWTYRGNIIRHNSIHDLFGYGLKNVDLAKNTVTYTTSNGVRGVYLDDAVSGFTVTGNIFNNAGYMAIQLGGGRDNRIENNLFNTDSYAILVDNRWPDYKWEENKKRLKGLPYLGSIWRSKYPELAQPMNHEIWPEGNIIRRNVIVSTKPERQTLRYWLPEHSNTLADNLVWNASGPIIVDYDILDRLKKKNNASWEDWIGEGIEHGSINADPCVTITGNHATFCKQSPIKQIGFQPIPSDIGLIK